MSEKDDNPIGYPTYPSEEDIFEKFDEASEIDPDDINKLKKEVDTNEFRQEAIDKIVKSGQLRPDELDVPGSELDDNDEEIGNEDEENNYYSLGGS